LWPVFFFSSRRPHTRLQGDWSSDVCSSDLAAFVPPQKPRIPTVHNENLVRTSIDRFIQSALEQRHLHLGSAADRATLLRRVSFEIGRASCRKECRWRVWAYH